MTTQYIAELKQSLQILNSALEKATTQNVRAILQEAIEKTMIAISHQDHIDLAKWRKVNRDEFWTAVAKTTPHRTGNGLEYIDGMEIVIGQFRVIDSTASYYLRND